MNRSSSSSHREAAKKHRSPLLRVCGSLLLLLAIVASTQLISRAQSYDPSLYGALRWRLVGPFRGGRVLAVAGISSDPNTYYFGGVAGGVWKTANGGMTWNPIFDDERIASIGAIAVAPSNQNVIYVGTGEADMRSDISFGRGVYRSDDAGKTWRLLGLDDTQQIGKIVVDPRNPDIALVAALGHAYGPNPERGVFRTSDGGKTWQKVLYRDANTGAIDLSMDPVNPKIVYATLWNAHRPPWSTYPPIGGPGGGLFVSNDEGSTWTDIKSHGLPTAQWGRSGVAIAPGTNQQRVYLLVDAKKGGGLYRTDNGGETWSLLGTDPRITTRAWYFSGVTIDPRNPDIIYVSDVAIYRSTDGGKTFSAFKGAPGGDDYHQLWIDSQNSARMILGCDQGAVVTVDGGKTWSSWYNQPTAQIYHVSTDNAFPYRIYGAQQDSGTVAILSHSDTGKITFRDWYSIGAGESGYIQPDPEDPNIVYGGDTYGGLHRYDRRTNQSQDISPAFAEFSPNISKKELRFTWTSPLVFAPWDSHVLYFGSQFLLRSGDQGNSWEKVSPDLTGAVTQQAETAGNSPPTDENAVGRGYGVIYSIAPSPMAMGTIWIGTDTGRIQLTQDDGKTWKNVAPSALSDWSKISILEASHFDAGTAYAAVDRHRLDDLNPHIFRTHDFGKTWTEITAGIPKGQYAQVVREDPVKKGLLYAGTELGVYVSFDGGDHWQPLQENLPVTSIRDLAIHGADLIAATHGRSFWVLDDISPLRQLNSSATQRNAVLLKPDTAIRTRTEEYDTPLPHDFPGAENFPDGAVLDYVLQSPPPKKIEIDILDVNGGVVANLSSDPAPQPPKNKSSYTDDWIEPVPSLTLDRGLNRFIWDFRYSRPEGAPAGGRVKGPRALPGDYTIRLTVNGEESTQPLKVVMDPRVKAPAADLQAQFDLESKISQDLSSCLIALREIHALYPQLKKLTAPSAGGSAESKAAAEKLKKEASALRGGAEDPSQAGSGLVYIGRRLLALQDVVDSADAAPTAQAKTAFADFHARANAAAAQWRNLKSNEVEKLNGMLRAAGQISLNLQQEVPPDYNPLAGSDD